MCEKCNSDSRHPDHDFNIEGFIKAICSYIQLHGTSPKTIELTPNEIADLYRETSWINNAHATDYDGRSMLFGVAILSTDEPTETCLMRYLYLNYTAGWITIMHDKILKEL